MFQNEKTVLLIESLGVLSPHYASLLSGNGYTVFTTAEPDKAIELIKVKQPKLSVIITNDFGGDSHVSTYENIMAESQRVILIDGQNGNHSTLYVEHLDKAIHVKGTVSKIALFQLCEQLLEKFEPDTQVRKAESQTILLVEDDPLNKTHMESLLSEFGLKYYSTGSFEEALIELNKNNYAMIMSDVNIIGGNGFELFKLAQTTPNKTTPFAIMSAYSAVEIKEMYKTTGSFIFLEKPLKMQDLAQILAMLDKTGIQVTHKAEIYSPFYIYDLFRDQPETLRNCFEDFRDCLNITLERIKEYKENPSGQNDATGACFHRLVNIGKYFGANRLIELIKSFKLSVDSAKTSDTLNEIEAEIKNLKRFYHQGYFEKNNFNRTMVY